MTKRLVVVSGKGGAGKTTCAVAVSLLMNKKMDVELVDADVEEPNSNLFVKASLNSRTVYRKIPLLSSEICNGCGVCVELCAYNAIVLVKERPLIFTDLCHSCGGCSSLCPQEAISEIDSEYGEIASSEKGDISFREGRIHVGKIQSPLLIRELLGENVRCDLQIVDAPPGTACNTVQALYDADFALIVVEPTPFGMSDFALIEDLVRQMGIPCAVVINKDEGVSSSLYSLCNERKIPIIGSIPFDHILAAKYSVGDLRGYIEEGGSVHYEPVVDMVEKLMSLESSDD
ncbi:MAG: P-loop NTPase [Spirochaetes bacterium]|jgi:MinD superfamily P-loop ATPase|nr:P-loop NTPase [Spirochaetota bacterium]